jgi:hypothetical protein
MHLIRADAHNDYASSSFVLQVLSRTQTTEDIKFSSNEGFSPKILKGHSMLGKRSETKSKKRHSYEKEIQKKINEKKEKGKIERTRQSLK